MSRKSLRNIACVGPDGTQRIKHGRVQKAGTEKGKVPPMPWTNRKTFRAWAKVQ